MEQVSEGTERKRDYIGIIAIILIVSIYIITGFLIKPEKETKCSSSGADISPFASQEYCVYKQVTVNKCIKLNERITVCNENIVDSLLNNTR